jgi:hypothetical protein
MQSSSQALTNQIKIFVLELVVRVLIYVVPKLIKIFFAMTSTEMLKIARCL